MEKEASRDLLLAGVGLTVAVLSGVAAVLLFTMQPDEEGLDEVDGAFD